MTVLLNKVIIDFYSRINQDGCFSSIPWLYMFFQNFIIEISATSRVSGNKTREEDRLKKREHKST